MGRTYTDSFILELKLNTSEKDDVFLSHCFWHTLILHNTLVRHSKKQISSMRQDPNYKKLLSEYKSLDKKDPRRKLLSKELSEIVSSYGLTKSDLEKFIKLKRKNVTKYVHSAVAQKIVSAVWKGVSKVLYSNGRQLHFCKFHDLLSIEAKSNNTGIVFDHNTLNFMNHIISVQAPNNEYEKECLTHRIKYCRIAKKVIGIRYHYYVQLILEGKPPIKHKMGTGSSGLDIGTSTVAFVSDSGCELTLLGDKLNQKDKEKRCIQRKIERSRRATNPGNYNSDGTVRKGRKKWYYSHNYFKLRMRYKSICRKYFASLKQEQEILANKLIEQTNQIYVETMNFKSLQKRSSETKRNSKGKYLSKKRFGHSLQVRAPAQFVSILKYKINLLGGELLKVNTIKFRASQYNHITDTYVKKKLSKRHNLIDNKWIQRDLYSAFLLKNSAPNLEHCDRTKCFKTYDNFLIQHDTCISNIKASGKKIPASFGF